MKVKDIIFEAERLETKANNYYNRNYSTYMECWMNNSSEEEYLKLKQDLFDYLDSEV
jgi:hypothetical protein